MLYVLGVHHFYQRRKHVPPFGNAWQKPLLDLYPADLARFEANRRWFSWRGIRGDAATHWVDRSASDWKAEYVKRLRGLIAERGIQSIYEEGCPTGASLTLTEDVAVDLGLTYFNVEPPLAQRPHPPKKDRLREWKYIEVLRWREDQWVSAIAQSHTNDCAGLLVVGGAHSSGKFYLAGDPVDRPGPSLLQALADRGIETATIAENDFWNGRPDYIAIMREMDREMGLPV